jgi:Holliday junction resolvase-like predicted endonuclease
VVYILKHDRHVEDLYQRLLGQYQAIYRGVPLYSRKDRLIGEIDMIAINRDTVDIFEVKCSFRPVKARKQLSKIRKILCGDLTSKLNGAVNLYFYHGDGNQLVKMSD